MKKRLFDIKAIIIIVMVFLLGGVSFYFGVKKVNSSYQRFYNNGYIIAETNDSGNSNKYFFASNSKYKANYDETITIVDTSDNKVSIKNDSFVHYEDNSLGATKKSVLLNLDALNTDVLKYYNFYEDSILNYKNKGYRLTLFDEELALNNFIVKVSDNKFMVVSKTLKLSIGDEKYSLKDYIELNFLDGNIVRVENKDNVFQNISTEMKLELENEIIIDLSNRNILNGEDPVVNLNQIIIDSSDNIDIPNNATTTLARTTKPVYVTTTTPKDSGFEDEDEVDEFINVVEPIFTVYDLTVTTYSVNCKIKVNDPNGLISGGIDIKVVESNTGKTVSTITETSWFYDISFSNKQLANNTDYNLIVTATINKDGRDYTKNYVQKTFRTESLGIEVLKDYFTENEMHFTIKKDAYSDVKSANVYLYDLDGNNLGAQKLTFDESVERVSFDYLTSNTNYILKIVDFDYNGLTVTNEDAIINTYKTLKTKPTSDSTKGFGDTLFYENKRDGIFTLSYTNIKDPDGGIVEYKYQIYNSADTSNPIKTFVSKNRDEIKVYMDEVDLKRNTNYVYKVVVVFNDNEKVVEYSSGFSDVMNIDGTKVPIINFVETKVNYSTIEGSVIINDVDSVIDVNRNITIVFRDSYGNTIYMTYSDISRYKGTDQTTYSLPVSAKDLKSNSMYMFDVFAAVDFSSSLDDDKTVDGNKNKYESYLLGTLSVRTSETIQFKAEWEDHITSAGATHCSKVFNIGLTLTPNPKKGDDPNSDAFKQQFLDQLEDVDSIQLTIQDYEGGYPLSTIINRSQIKDTLVLGKQFNITPDMFMGNDAESFFTKDKYSLKLVDVLDAEQNKFELFLDTREITIYPCISKIPDYKDLLKRNYITSSELSKEETISDDTEDTKKMRVSTGYEIGAGFSDKYNVVKEIKYYAYNAEDLTAPPIVKQITNDRTDDVPALPKHKFYYHGEGDASNNAPEWYKRGGEFKFSYELIVAIMENGKETYECLYPAYQMESNYDPNDVDFSKLSSCTAVGGTPTPTSNVNSKFKISLLETNTFDTFIQDNEIEQTTSAKTLISKSVYPHKQKPFIYLYPVGAYSDPEGTEAGDRKCSESSCYHFSYKLWDMDRILVPQTLMDENPITATDPIEAWNEEKEKWYGELLVNKAKKPFKYCFKAQSLTYPCEFEDLYIPMSTIRNNVNPDHLDIAMEYSLTKDPNDINSNVYTELFKDVETKLVDNLTYNFSFTVVKEQYVKVMFTTTDQAALRRLVKINARFYEPKADNSEPEYYVDIDDISINSDNYKLNYEDGVYYFIVPLAALQNVLKNKEISISAELFYDSGEYSYDFVYNKEVNYDQLYSVKDKNSDNYYYCRRDKLGVIDCLKNNTESTLLANGSIFKLNSKTSITNKYTIKLSYDDQILKSKTLDFAFILSPHGHGYSSKDLNVFPQKIKTKTIKNIKGKDDQSTTFTFDKVKPMFVLESIEPCPVSADINYIIAGLEGVSNKIFFNLKTTIDNVIYTKEVPVEVDFTKDMQNTTLDVLEYFDYGTQEEKIVYYSVSYCTDDACTSKETFKSSSNIDEDFTGVFKLTKFYEIKDYGVAIENSYNSDIREITRKFKVAFEISNPVGFDKIRYRVVEGEDEREILTFSQDNTGSVKYISSYKFDPDLTKNKLVLGKSYRIYVEAIKVNSAGKVIVLTAPNSHYDFYLETYAEPNYTIVVRRKQAEQKLYLDVNVEDPQYIVRNLNYNIGLYKDMQLVSDGERFNNPVNTPKSLSFVLNNLLDRYMVQFKYYADLNLNGTFEPQEEITKNYDVQRGNNFDITISDDVSVSLTPQSNPIINFYKSDNIQLISQIDYTIMYNGEDNSQQLLKSGTLKKGEFGYSENVLTSSSHITITDFKLTGYSNFSITFSLSAGSIQENNFTTISQLSRTFTK